MGSHFLTGIDTGSVYEYVRYLHYYINYAKNIPILCNMLQRSITRKVISLLGKAIYPVHGIFYIKYLLNNILLISLLHSILEIVHIYMYVKNGQT